MLSHKGFIWAHTGVLELFYMYFTMDVWSIQYMVVTNILTKMGTTLLVWLGLVIGRDDVTSESKLGNFTYYITQISI